MWRGCGAEERLGLVVSVQVFTLDSHFIFNGESRQFDKIYSKVPATSARGVRPRSQRSRIRNLRTCIKKWSKI